MQGNNGTTPFKESLLQTEHKKTPHTEGLTPDWLKMAMGHTRRSHLIL